MLPPEPAEAEPESVARNYGTFRVIRGGHRDEHTDEHLCAEDYDPELENILNLAVHPFDHGVHALGTVQLDREHCSVDMPLDAFVVHNCLSDVVGVCLPLA